MSESFPLLQNIEEYIYSLQSKLDRLKEIHLIDESRKNKITLDMETQLKKVTEVHEKLVNLNTEVNNIIQWPSLDTSNDESPDTEMKIKNKIEKIDYNEKYIEDWEEMLQWLNDSYRNQHQSMELDVDFDIDFDFNFNSNTNNDIHELAFLTKSDMDTIYTIFDIPSLLEDGIASININDSITK